MHGRQVFLVGFYPPPLLSVLGSKACLPFELLAVVPSQHASQKFDLVNLWPQALLRCENGICALWRESERALALVLCS
jgi:hypothetical protein